MPVPVLRVGECWCSILSGTFMSSHRHHSSGSSKGEGGKQWRGRTESGTVQCGLLDTTRQPLRLRTVRPANLLGMGEWLPGLYPSRGTGNQGRWSRTGCGQRMASGTGATFLLGLALTAVRLPCFGRWAPHHVHTSILIGLSAFKRIELMKKTGIKEMWGAGGS